MSTITNCPNVVDFSVRPKPDRRDPSILDRRAVPRGGLRGYDVGPDGQGRYLVDTMRKYLYMEHDGQQR